MRWPSCSGAAASVAANTVDTVGNRSPLVETGTGPFAVYGLRIAVVQHFGGPGRKSVLSVAAEGVAVEKSPAVRKLRFRAHGSGPCLGSPVLAGQKRKLLERYVETRPDRNDPSHPNPNTGADSPHVNCPIRTRTRSFRASFRW